MGIPRLTKDGILPRCVHRTTLAETRRAFGGRTARRAELMMMLEEAVDRARKAGITRILINGSFVTAKKEPRDIDVVFQVSDVYAQRLSGGNPDAAWIAERVREARPKALDLFVAVDDEEWVSWVRLFESDAWCGKKGLVEVVDDPE